MLDRNSIHTLWIAGLMALQPCSGAVAQSAIDLTKCTAIDADGLRLACYDAAAGRNQKPPGWIVDEKVDPIDGKRRLVAHVSAIPPHDSDAAIAMRCIGSNIDVLIMWPPPLGSGERLDARWRVDGNAIVSGQFQKARSGNTLFVPTWGVMLTEIADGRLLHVSVQTEDRIAETITFNISGARAVVNRLYEVCFAR